MLYVLHRTRSENANIHVVLKKIIPFYQKANVPVITEKKAYEKITGSFQKNEQLGELPVNCHSSLSVRTKIKETEVELIEVFLIRTKNAENIVKNQEDMEFLQSMKTHRAASSEPAGITV